MLRRRGGAAPQDAQTLPERLREALEALGPTFVIRPDLATRSDLLDPAWTDELDRLHSQAAVLPWETLASQIIADLGANRNSVCRIRSHAAGAASMAQIYRARLHSGEQVVVKVLRPVWRKPSTPICGCWPRWRRSEQQSPALARYRPRQMVRALATALNHELDLTHEGHNCDRVAGMFARQPDVVVPKIYWQYSSSPVSAGILARHRTGKP